MSELKRFALVLAVITAIGVSAEFASTARKAPARDRDPQPVESIPDGRTTPMSTSLVLPGGKEVPLPFDRAIAIGEELDYLTDMNCCWRVTRIRLRVFESHTVRLIYVEEMK
jgi:hypothetical protein